MPNGGTLPANSSLTGAIIIPNSVVVGDVGAKLAAGDIAGALQSSPNLLTKSSLWFAVPNPGQALSNMLPGAANREPAKAATTILVVPLDGRAPQFGGAAPESFQFGPPLPPNGDRAVAFNNMRASGDGSSVSFANAGFVLPVPGGDKVGGALATALERVAGRNNNPAQPGTFADDAVATVVGSSLRNAKIYAGFGWPGGISERQPLAVGPQHHRDRGPRPPPGAVPGLDAGPRQPAGRQRRRRQLPRGELRHRRHDRDPRRPCGRARRADRGGRLRRGRPPAAPRGI
jgi:hypothetical protein